MKSLCYSTLLFMSTETGNRECVLQKLNEGSTLGCMKLQKQAKCTKNLQADVNPKAFVQLGKEIPSISGA